MDGGRSDLEVGLEVTFSGRSAVDLSVGIDETQILPLQGSERRQGIERDDQRGKAVSATPEEGADSAGLR